MEFDKISGIVSIIISIYGAMYGKTIVQPGCELNTWYNYYYGYYQNVQFVTLLKVTRDQYTKLYYFEKRVLQPDGDFIKTTDPFQIESMQRLNYACNLSVTNANGALTKHEFYRLADFTLRASLVAPVTKSGLFPPGAPYSVWIKLGANKLQSTCTPIAWYEREFRTQVMLPDNGSVVTRIGIVNYNYWWPPLIWAGEYYEH
jgi:hypothetical protein